MGPPNNPSFPNVVMGSYWGVFHVLDPLGGLGSGLGLRSLEVRVALGGVQSNSCCSLSEAFLVERSSHISPGPHVLQSPAEKKPNT